MPLSSGRMTVSGPTAGANEVNRAFEIVSLAADQHEIEGLFEIFRQNGGGIGQSHISEAAANS